MKAITKCHIVFVFAIILTISSCNMPFSSAEISTIEKASLFATNVVGLDVSRYVISKTSIDTYPIGTGSSWDEQITQRLEYGESKIEITYDFRNKELVGCYVWAFGNTPIFNHTSLDALDAAKGFLERYRTFSKATYYPTLQNTLNVVNGLKPTTVSEGDITLSIHFQEYGVIYFDWMKTVNGIKNPHNRVGVAFQNGYFLQFVDNWNLYPIGSADAKLSKEHALNIAMKQAQTFTYTIGGETIGNLQVVSAPFAELTLQPRSKALYPLWEIYLALDKIYPANVASLHITLWADTGEINSITATSTLGVSPELLDSSTGNTITPNELPNQEGTSPALQNLPTSIAVILAISVPILVGTIILKRRKRIKVA